jgi:hypothetical protein
MSKRSRTSKNGPKPVSVRVELTLAEISIISKVFTEVIEREVFEEDGLERLRDIETKILNAPSA